MRPSVVPVLAIASIALSGAFGASMSACSSHAPAASTTPTRSCDTVVWYQPKSDADVIEVVGDFNGWSRPGIMLSAGRSDGWRVTSINFTPGEHTYAIVDDGQWLTDQSVGTTAYQDGTEVTWINVLDCASPGITVQASSGSATGAAQITASFVASSSGDPIDPKTFAATDRDGTSIAMGTPSIDPAQGTIAISATGLAAGKHTITLSANDTKGRVADPAIATIWIEPNAWDWKDAVIYQIMVDRYRNAQGALPDPATPGSRAGGNVDGVRNAIESGELAALGVNTLWLSPLYQNTENLMTGFDGRLYAGYHGYWPKESRTLEPSQATEDSLDALMTSAHAHGMRVLFDVVPNHVQQEHPYLAHLEDGWFNHPDGSCICGGTNCDWDDHITDCWFTPFLPDLAWKDSVLATQATSDVKWWMDRFDSDGIRIDAIPMMPRSANRRISQAIRATYDNPGHASFILGENFTSDYGALRYDLGPDGIDSEFHFPLMWSLRSVVGQEDGLMSDLDGTIHDGENAWAGSGAVMSLMLDNADVSRFASASEGTDTGDTWVSAPQSINPLVYMKQTLAFGAIFTLPGAPVIYYGDEVALAGKGDPDSRHVLPAESTFSALQLQTRASVRAFSKLRACSASLRRGTYRTLAAGDEYLVYAREADGEATAVVLLQRSPTAQISVALPGIAKGEYVEALSGASVSLDPALTSFDPASFSVRVYLPSGNACAASAQ